VLEDPARCGDQCQYPESCDPEEATPPWLGRDAAGMKYLNTRLYYLKKGYVAFEVLRHAT
jgi:hypothetical protein